MLGIYVLENQSLSNLALKFADITKEKKPFALFKIKSERFYELENSE